MTFAELCNSLGPIRVELCREGVCLTVNANRSSRSRRRIISTRRAQRLLDAYADLYPNMKRKPAPEHLSA